MNPRSVQHARPRSLTDLPNVGPAMARHLESIGIRTPEQLVGRDPLELYRTLCARRGARLDPCVLDTFMSITDYMAGHTPRRWWKYTAERKRRYGKILAAARKS
jgi:hypothetical protein